jgi:biotin synthase
LTWLDALTEKALARELPTRAEALNVLQSTDDELMDVVAAAFKVRLRYFGRRVKLNYLVNIKSGLCPEDCFYCSQRAGSAADVLKYTWLKPDEVISNAEAGVKAGAKRVCLVASGRGPTDADVTRVSGAIGKFKEQHPDVEVCACLGLLSDGQAERLHQAGTTAYNHNLNTAETNYADICTTHSYQDRADTVRKAKQAGLSPCSGLIAGMGETDEELADVVFALRELDPLGAGQLPDPVQGHPAGRPVGSDPAALPAHPGHGPVHLPGRRGPAGRRPGNPPAQPAAARAAHRQLDLPRRLPDQRGPGRRP